jgi:acid stress chaperone HdeB
MPVWYFRVREFENKETEMSRLGQAWLALSLSVVAVLPAHAQVTVDVSKITCDQYTLARVGSPHEIAVWMSGYYHGTRHNTVLDTQELRENTNKVMDFCLGNPTLTLMDAIEKVLGAKQ